MNISMWIKALQVIPRIDKNEWDQLDVISKWLISTRAAVLVMTFISAALAGIFAYQDGAFNFWYWLLVTIGLIFAHAVNNLLNDYTDYVKGVDHERDEKEGQHTVKVEPTHGRLALIRVPAG